MSNKTIPAGYNIVTEGKASILTPSGISQNVFYNPAQIINRDLSILVINHYIQLYKMELKIMCITFITFSFY